MRTEDIHQEESTKFPPPSLRDKKYDILKYKINDIENVRCSVALEWEKGGGVALFSVWSASYHTEDSRSLVKFSYYTHDIKMDKTSWTYVTNTKTLRRKIPHRREIISVERFQNQIDFPSVLCLYLWHVLL